MKPSTRMVVLSNRQKYVLDLISVRAAATYGLRRLYASWTGAAIRVRRSSDNTEIDIGFSANGDLNTAALLTFVGAGDGFVTTWYDQSGNDRHAAQSLAVAQPRIVTSGAIETQNGRPTVFQSQGNQSLPISGGFTGITSATGIFVFRQMTGIAGAHDFRASDGFFNHSPLGNDGVAYDGFFSTNRRTFTNYGTATFPSTITLTTHTVRHTGTALQLFKNGSQIDTDKPVGFRTYPSGDASLFNSQQQGTAAASEAIIFGTAISTTTRQTLERNQGIYFNISVS